MSDWQQAESWNHSLLDEEAEPSQHVKHTSGHRSLTEVSSWLSSDRTDCPEPHHPSLAQWCPDCNGKNARKQAEINKQADRDDFEW